MPIPKQNRAVSLRQRSREHLSDPSQDALRWQLLPQEREGKVHTTGREPAGTLSANRATDSKGLRDCSARSRARSLWNADPYPLTQGLVEFMDWLDE